MEIPKFYERVRCADGANVSVQAGAYLYSTPRDNQGPYTHIEAGFPSVVPPASWMPYADNDLDYTEVVYGYMPVELVAEFINVHGGMVSGELPPANYGSISITPRENVLDNIINLLGGK